ncbi:hypothetical protein, partial [Paraburkholderia hospita]|uniref:hypothetical protein n=1 Tax=Paraburkholderia hospita TaxID=169430 RepID=UPI001A995A3F
PPRTGATHEARRQYADASDTQSTPTEAASQTHNPKQTQKRKSRPKDGLFPLKSEKKLTSR